MAVRRKEDRKVAAKYSFDPKKLRKQSDAEFDEVKRKLGDDLKATGGHRKTEDSSSKKILHSLNLYRVEG